MRKSIILNDYNIKEASEFSFGNIMSEYSANGLYFLKGGKPYLPISGEFHFSRYNNNEWRRELLKMKANGVNTVATYIFWNHHEYNKGEYDFSGDRDIHKFLSICKDIGMPCILRIGPWAHGECIYGGFPKHVQSLIGKRKDSKKYLEYVYRFWRRLYEEVKDYLDGITVIGIQLENEYNGPISHIHTLRDMAVKIGYRTPFFTMTAWPTNTPDREILPTFGGYPEAPWTWHKNRLEPRGRFAICNGRTEVEIGEDLIKKAYNEKKSFADYPYAGCEVGVGNQVTQHRRPLIDDNDGYGVAFAKFASGMNWIGYYMYHGGRNPLNHLYQENRLTLYPNNYPIVDYDFQAPLSKDGVVREHCKRLRLLHYFINYWDNSIATKRAFFASEEDKEVYPYCSVRCDDNLSGYLFVSNYERSADNKDMPSFGVDIVGKSQRISLPDISVRKNAMFFMPFNFDIDGVHIDYITAQPVAKIGDTYHMVMCDGLKPEISIGGKVKSIDCEYKIGRITVKVMNKDEAYRFFVFDSKAYLSDSPMFEDKGKLYKENTRAVESSFSLEKSAATRLPYGYFLYSYSKRHYFKFKLDRDLINKHYDTIVKMKFTGLNLQVFAGKKLIDDYFNTDGIYEFHTRQLARYIGDNEYLTIKAVAATKFGVGKVYNEIDIPCGKVDLSVESVEVMDIEEI